MYDNSVNFLIDDDRSENIASSIIKLDSKIYKGA